MQKTSESTVLPTTSTRGLGGARGADRSAYPTLTILAHPKAARVGDRAVLGELLTGTRAQLSRLQPEFTTPGSLLARPLDDPYVSRKPWTIERFSPESWRLSATNSPTSLEVDGRRVTDHIEFSTANIDRGMVLVIAERIVVLLHHHRPGATRSNDAECQQLASLVGHSDVMRELRDEIRRVSDVEVDVLIRGETGTGKELVAHALHSLGRHPKGPFVDVNVGAIPQSLVASELFGSVRGAFTGATGAQQGCFARAKGGTLFLDEIGEAPPEVQISLLRTLETREVQPLGGTRAQRVNVRVVSATDADLESQIADGSFREPLLHRLASYEISLPSLSKRRDDIGRLLVHFLRHVGPHPGPALDLGGDQPWIETSLISQLAQYHWPGNVRQLRNVVRQLTIGNRGQQVLRSTAAIDRMLAAGERTSEMSGSTEKVLETQPKTEATSAPRPTRRPAEIDDKEILAALRVQRFEIKAAAKDLGISRAALYAWIEQSPMVKTAGQLSNDSIRLAHDHCAGDLAAMAVSLEVSSFALRRRVRELGLET